MNRRPKTFTCKLHTIQIRFQLTDELREMAADLCALMASSDHFSWFAEATLALGLDIGRDELGTEHPAAYLAREALWYVRDSGIYLWNEHRERWSEAEAMLREGWTP